MRFEIEIRNVQKENEAFFVGFYSTIMAKYFPIASRASCGKQQLNGMELVEALKDGTEEYYKRLGERSYNEDFIERERVRLEGIWGKNYERILLSDVYEVVSSEANLCACEISCKRLPKYP